MSAAKRKAMEDELVGAQQEQLDELLAVGSKLKVLYGEGNPNNKVIEIRAHVDGMIVHREWFERRQEWHYTIESRYAFELRFTDGRLSKP